MHSDDDVFIINFHFVKTCGGCIPDNFNQVPTLLF